MPRRGPEIPWRIDVAHRLAPEEIDRVTNLVAAAKRADGHEGLTDDKRLELAAGGHEGFTAFLARRHRGSDDTSGDDLGGYAQLGRSNDSWGLETVVHPRHRDESATVTALLLEAALTEVAGRGGGRLHLWVPKPSVTMDRLAADHGLVPGRDLLQMRLPLPLPPGQPPLATRPFQVGTDEAAWLAVNNRAFATHPEQGGWTLATLQRREREPWFDPVGFLLHEREGRLAASCWTKVHHDTDPPMGEIYVISVDPDFQGLGLGKAMTVAGLDHLASVGLTTGMLYVDAANIAAVGLYRGLGFTVDHIDRAYVGTVG
jgi:mycothiol synthase